MLSAPLDTLTTDDLPTLQNELHEVRDIWFSLGVQLKVPMFDLRAIRAEYRDNPSNCLLEMLSTWLSITIPSPTWQTVVDALCTPAIARTVVAEKVRRTHCNKDSDTLMYITVIECIHPTQMRSQYCVSHDARDSGDTETETTGTYTFIHTR